MKHRLYFIMIFAMLSAFCALAEKVGDYEDFATLKAAAESGDTNAMYQLAQCYEKGLHVDAPDMAEAFYWYNEAAENGDMYAMHMLAYFCEQGIIVEKNYDLAFHWYNKAAELGLKESMNNIGMFYYSGRSVPVNYQKAVEWFTKSALAGNPFGMYNLATCYENGQGVELDYEKAASWFEQAANGGHSGAMNELAYFYRKGLGVPVDYEKSFEYFSKAADAGEESGMFNLSNCYYQGLGCERNLNFAYHWAMRAAKAGNPTSMNRVGYYLLKGIGVKKNAERAFGWFLKAAEAGNSTGMMNVASCYKTGNGVARDLDKAWEWYCKAEIAENEEATEQLAQMTAKGYKPGNDNSQVTFLPTDIMDSDVDIDIPESKQSKTNTFALIIANENYRREVAVDFAMRDGEKVYEYVTKRLGVPTENARLVSDATLIEMYTHIDWLEKVASAYGPDIKILVYYSGHGMPDAQTKQSYLIPIDGNSQDRESCVPLDELYRKLSSLKTQATIVLLDACFSGTERNDEMLAAARGVAIAAKPEQVSGNMIVLSATQAGETAYAYKQKNHGLFTYYLLKGLKETPGAVNVKQLADYVLTQVKQRAILVNNKPQTPTVRVSPAFAQWEQVEL